jgi:hypothetical protein
MLALNRIRLVSTARLQYKNIRFVHTYSLLDNTHKSFGEVKIISEQTVFRVQYTLLLLILKMKLNIYITYLISLSKPYHIDHYMKRMKGIFFH